MQKMIWIFLLASVLIMVPVQARAFLDPVTTIGMLVNRVMNYIIDNANRPKPAKRLDWRIIPADAISGVMDPPNGREVKIDGKTMMMSPGYKIRDFNNRIIQSMRIQNKVNILYTLDTNKQVHAVWLMP